MNLRPVRVYNRAVGSAWRALARFLPAFALAAFAGTGVCAAAQTIPTSGTPIVFAAIRGRGDITIRTWNKPQVAVDGTGVTVRHIAHVNARHVPPITFFAATVQTPSGPLTLEPEPFVAPPFDPYGHDAVRILGEGGHVTITIPASTPFLVARLRQGAIVINGFHGGTFVAQAGAGRVRLNDVGGTGAVQVNSGLVIATNSTFDRLRVRTARGNMFFENCTSRQIEATSLLGSIVYDDGSFQPGLARFESERGAIALGVRGGAQIQAHTQSGRVLSEGTIGAGPTVTATSRSGNIVYYAGTLRNHPKLARQFAPRAVRRIDGLKRRPQKRKCCGRP